MGRVVVLHPAAHAVEQTLERLFVETLRAAKKELLNVWLRTAGLSADGVAVHRSVAPAENPATLFLRDPLKNPLALQTVVLFHRQKAHGHAICTRFG